MRGAKPTTMKTPHIKTIGILQYHLGEIKDNYIQYDFAKIKTYLNAQGKLMFGPHFKLYQEDDALIYKLCSYFIDDHQTCANLGIDTDKGLLLSGPVGCGKTTLMKLLPQIMPYNKPFEVVPTRNIIFNFNAKGFEVLAPYSENEVFCFDDLGIESTGCHFGKECNVMGEILLSRYDLFMQKLQLSNKTNATRNQQPRTNNQNKTHITTNLNAKELEDRYGNRVRSRMRAMFNLISFNKDAVDKRQ